MLLKHHGAPLWCSSVLRSFVSSFFAPLIFDLWCTKKCLWTAVYFFSGRLESSFWTKLHAVSGVWGTLNVSNGLNQSVAHIVTRPWYARHVQIFDSFFVSEVSLQPLVPYWARIILRNNLSAIFFFYRVYFPWKSAWIWIAPGDINSISYGTCLFSAVVSFYLCCHMPNRS